MKVELENVENRLSADLSFSYKETRKKSDGTGAGR